MYKVSIVFVIKFVLGIKFICFSQPVFDRKLSFPFKRRIKDVIPIGEKGVIYEVLDLYKGILVQTKYDTDLEFVSKNEISFNKRIDYFDQYRNATHSYTYLAHNKRDFTIISADYEGKEYSKFNGELPKNVAVLDYKVLGDICFYSGSIKKNNPYAKSKPFYFNLNMKTGKFDFSKDRDDELLYAWGSFEIFKDQGKMLYPF